MAKFKMAPTVPVDEVVTARLGSASGSANYLTDTEVGKAVKLTTTDSLYNLCAAGDPIEGFIVAIESASLDDFSIGSVLQGGRKTVLCDGLQATPGTGTIAIGDYVVMGTAVVKGTSLAATGYCKVCKATNQPGATVTAADNLVATVNAAIAKVVDSTKVAMFAWRVVSLGNAGAVGDTAVIERVNV